MLPLTVIVKSSRWHFVGSIFGLLVVCLCVVLVWPPWWQSSLFIGLAIYLTSTWCWRYVWLQHPLSIVQINATVVGWRIFLADGSERNVQLVSGCRFLPHLIVLRMHCEAKKSWWCLLLSDSAEQDTLRRLRVIGRWRPNANSGAPALP